MTSRMLRVGITTLIAAAMWAGASATAHAATHPDRKSDSEVSVSVPAATPSTRPSTPASAPPASDGGGAGTGAGGTPVRSNGGTGTAPAADTTAPTAAACVPKEPAIPTAPKTGGGEASVDEEVYAVGDTVTATAAGFGANEQVQLVLFSEPSLVGTFAADATGSVTAQFVVAAETLAGGHVLQFTGWCGSISTADVFVGATNSAAGGVQGVPAWMWWVGGALALAILVVGVWWITRLMRVPVAPEAVPA